MQAVGKGEVEIYNEISLQHELGFYLREHFKNQKSKNRVQFERNVSDFDFEPPEGGFEKREIDIVIKPTYSEKLLCAIELKCPRNGQVPESMFSFCKDIAFLEQLVWSGFPSAYFLAVADHRLFYSDSESNENIYRFFRSGKLGQFRGSEPITGIINKPTGSDKHKQVEIDGSYQVEWLPVSGDLKYCLISVGSKPLHYRPLEEYLAARQRQKKLDLRGTGVKLVA